jgi:hypothetical protein
MPVIVRTALAVLALVTAPEVITIIAPSGVAHADVCVGGGRRISVSGCANIADTIAQFAPPPAEYAPVPDDYPPPPPVDVNVCASAGRRVTVSGCV